MDNVATPHVILDDEVVAVPHRNIDNIGPAGSILSSALEMTYWMRAMLGEGAFDKTRIVSEDVVSELWKEAEHHLPAPKNLCKALSVDPFFDLRSRLGPSRLSGTPRRYPHGRDRRHAVANPSYARRRARDRRAHEYFAERLARAEHRDVSHRRRLPRRGR